jgi:hypothetical protein
MNDEVYAVAGVEFGQQPGHVGLHGPGADAEPVGDLGVGQSFGNEQKDLVFAAGDGSRER